ncbi:cation diffusion facilitator family transporter [Romboutsia hominis]|uniref:Cation diffusion facilitator transporter n=1 Tax=Romboutsia hominis TaxID=1507512 RepID=A0A2P2BRG4_9FIRM|nr:cation diffusion facilitator family transporter [Romboutsia hominis]CEI72892.1 Cation diffusion facilitator transporter [Romboutsia hominis]
MISNFLVKSFIKNSEDINNESVRNRYGYLAGIVGIVLNLLLFIMKFSVGFITSSIAITADAFNNFSDMASSIITIVGFKLASMPPDKEHPFGHGRIEYISALIVAFMVMFVGVSFTKTSIQRILNPEVVVFEFVPFILLIISIAIKLWLSRFNKHIGQKIDSSALKASAADALGDVFTSSCVVLSYLASKYISFPIDGYIGVLVSLAIIYAGFTLVKETISPLLGEAPDPHLVKAINEKLLSYDYISGVHDLIIHNYGVGRRIASVHVEIPATIDIMTIHNIIDNAEYDISKELNIHLVIHMDPICMKDSEIVKTRNELNEILKKHKDIKSMHDFRIIGNDDVKTLVFDVVTSHDKDTSDDEIIKYIKDEVKKIHPHYKCKIIIDKDYH